MDVGVTLHEAVRPETVLEVVAARVPEAFFRTMLFLGTAEVLRVGEACRGLRGAVEGGDAIEVKRKIIDISLKV